MSIGRIKEIKNIGAFADFKNGSSLGFKKLTFIYGFNTYGKTTLSDIFQSLKSDDPQIIYSRKTIPIQANSQKIILTQKDQIENEIQFKNNQWDENNLRFHIEIFGTDFINKNLFTGLDIKRENKENFTKFILGEEGVKIVNDIESKKRTREQKKRLLKEKCPPFIKSETDENKKNKFLQTSIQELNKNDIEQSLLSKGSDLETIKEQIAEPQKILELEEPDEYEPPKNDFIKTIDLINISLQRDYSNMKDEALRKLKLHLDSNFTEQDKAESWLREGMDYCIDKENGDCPFCGQSLKGAKEITDTYLSYFNSAYTHFISEIENDLSEKNQSIMEHHFSEKTNIQDTLTKATNFKTFIVDEDFQKNLSELKNVIAQLKETELNSQKDEMLKQIQGKCKDKNKLPYKKLQPINYDNFKTVMDVYNNLLTRVTEVVKNIKNQIDVFKKLYRNNSTMQNKINQLEQEIKSFMYKKARIEQDKECREYINLITEIDELDKNINSLRTRLESEQSLYLDNYFTEINNLFKQLGSKNFILERKIEKMGNMTVYFLDVKFHNKKIQNDQIKSVFSDSDRRALALSIFYAKINLKNDSQKEKLIIVLDDPITSFDDNRVTESINLFKDTIEEVRQMIILTHYTHLIKRFCEITKEKRIATEFLKIEQDDITSFLEKSNRDDFIKSKYEKAFTKIYGFINKKHKASIKTDLRPFFENFYLPVFFAKQIRDKNVDCSSLETMINGIFENNNEIKQKMHKFRETLNPDSHTMTSNNDEDVRIFAGNMIDYLFNIQLNS